MVRTIKQKIWDIAEAAWENGDSADYGRRAHKRMARLEGQIEKLATVAIQHRFLLSDDQVEELLGTDYADEVLAEALVGAWDKVAAYVEPLQISAAKKARHAKEQKDDFYADDAWDVDGAYGLESTPADPITGVRVTLTVQGDLPPKFFQKCCGALKPGHKSRCREV